MLVLTRKPGDSIVIGDQITIKFIEIKGGAIRIGIDAPRDCKIYRQEIYDRISQENREALQWNLEDIDSLSTKIKVDKKEQ
jgi:carbon storage regulator